MSGNLFLFILASLLLLMTPGPAVLYIVARSLSQGIVAGFVSSLGLTAGGLVQVTAAALGVAALLETSMRVFHTLKWAGAFYLIYLGLRTLSQPEDLVEAAGARGGLGMVFWEGLLVNLLNPKSALFVFAFLPQFVDPETGFPAIQIFQLGVLFLLLGLLTDSVYVVSAGYLGSKARSWPRFAKIQRVITGGVFIGLGIAAGFGQ